MLVFLIVGQDAEQYAWLLHGRDCVQGPRILHDDQARQLSGRERESIGALSVMKWVSKNVQLLFLLLRYNGIVILYQIKVQMSKYVCNKSTTVTNNFKITLIN